MRQISIEIKRVWYTLTRINRDVFRLLIYGHYWIYKKFKAVNGQNPQGSLSFYAWAVDTRPASYTLLFWFQIHRHR